MEPPLCRSCGQKHWSRVCDEVTSPVTNDVTKPVTKPPPVTPTVTPIETVPSTVAPSKLRKAQAEIAALTAEVAHLKRQLAERPPLKVPTTSTERMRKLRSKGK